MIRGTREWAVAEINCCIGCSHGCRYCYGRARALKDGVVGAADEWLNCRVVDKDVTLDYPLYSGQVMFPAAHDIVPGNLDSCMHVIKSLLEKGNRVLIVSKPTPECIVEICDVFEPYREQILFRFTITARNDEILGVWEPAAPPYSERLRSLKVAYDSGFATSVSIEPMLDAGDIIGLTAEITPLVSHSIWIGKMNRIAERVSADSPEVQREIVRIEREQTDTEIWRIYQCLKKSPIIRWKESIKEVVGLPLVEELGQDI